jgi:nucleotide-binding universal stress UspA family protein
MNSVEAGAPVVVGIDGSQAAINAAVSPTDVAADRGVPLRLVHVVTIDDEDTDLDEDPSDVAADWPETEFGKAALRGASVAVDATGNTITVDSEILWGDTDAMLLKESATAAMMCVGSVGIALLCEQILGSTATSLAQQADCPVAVIRLGDDVPTVESEWIVTVVDGTRDSNAVVTWALDTARLRRTPVLALGIVQHGQRGIDGSELERRVVSWRKQRPHMHIYPLTFNGDVSGFLADHDELAVQLTVIGAADAEQVAKIVGAHRHSRDSRIWSSVLVVR